MKVGSQKVTQKETSPLSEGQRERGRRNETFGRRKPVNGNRGVGQEKQGDGG